MISPVSTSTRAHVDTSPRAQVGTSAPLLGDAVPVVSLEGLDRDDWLAWRRQGIGGSDAAAICGISPWRSRLEVWADKLGALPASEETEAMRWGTLLEDVIAGEVERTTPGLQLHRVAHMVRHPGHYWMLANIDRAAVLDGRCGVYEGKTTGAWSADGWADGQIPDQYLLQGQHYLAVTGLPYVLYAVLIGGQRLQTGVVDRDDELIDHLVELEHEFWFDHVLTGRPPPPDGSKATTDLLAHLWDVQPGKTVTVDRDETLGLLAERAHWVTLQRDAEQARATVENRLKLLVGDGEEAVDGDGERLFTWRQTDRQQLDAKALAAEEPELAERYMRSVAVRRLHIPTSKGETGA